MSDLPLIQRNTSIRQQKRRSRSARQAWRTGSTSTSNRRPGSVRLLSFAAGAAVAVLLLASPFIAQTLDGFSPKTAAPDASLDVLRHRLSLVGTTDPQQASTLNEELQRIHRYEKQLRKRAAALDAILKDALELDYNKIEQLTPLEESRAAEYVEGLGVGGGREAQAPIVRLPSKRSIAAKRLGPAQGSNLVGVLEYQTEQLSHLPLGAPVPGKISSHYGYRRSPFSRRRRMHHGIDFSIDNRTVVRATGDGVVKEAGYIGAYGRTVVIDHGNGYETLYGHLSKVNVKVGTSVCRGERIGLAGSTGRSTGPHVHYEVRHDGKSTNPKPLVELASFLKLI